MLYGVMIYSTTDGYEDAQIVLADSAELKTTADEKHLMLTMYAGERFRNMQAQGNMMARANVPYMRETFIQETDLIPFDNNFNRICGKLKPDSILWHIKATVSAARFLPTCRTRLIGEK